MKILKSFVFVAGLAFFAIQASAQTTTQTSPESQNMAQKMTASVKQTVTNITPDQENTILAIEETYANGMIEARNSSNGDREVMRSKMVPLKATRDSQMKTVLTADQFAQYQKAEAAKAGHKTAY